MKEKKNTMTNGQSIKNNKKTIYNINFHMKL